MEDDGLILVTGSEGFIGSRFVELFPQKNVVHAPKHIDFDITKNEEITALFKSYNFKAVVHFAAKANISDGEKERDNVNGEFYSVNVLGTKNLAEAASNTPGLIFVYISTDMVFPGSVKNPGPYSENYPVEPDLKTLTWYGYTKALAELEVQRVFADKSVILRLARPVGSLNDDSRGNYLKEILNNYDSGNSKPLLIDQKISLSYIDHVCLSIDMILNKKLSGVYHITSSNTVSPYQLASYVLEREKDEKGVIKSITLEDFLKKNNLPSTLFPKFAGLNSEKSQKILGIKFGTWKEIVDSIVDKK